MLHILLCNTAFSTSLTELCNTQTREIERERRGTILFRFEHAAIYTLPEYSAILKAECSTKSDIMADILREIADTKIKIF